MIRLAVPDLGDADIAAVVAVLRTGSLVQGERVREFEKGVARVVGTPFAVATSSGTAALHLALMALQVGPGDSVVVPAYTWPATANVVANVGARCVFVDIDPTTLNMSAEALEQALSQKGPISAVLPVHAFGNMVDMVAVVELASRFGVTVVEDAACALGAQLGGRGAGAWGTLGCFSFHPRKLITTGEGGSLTGRDEELCERLRALRNHGQRSTKAGIEFLDAGLNYRMTEFQAALGLGQFARLEATTNRRRAIARDYDRALSEHGFEVPVALGPRANVYQSYVALVPKDLTGHVPELIDRMRRRGVEAAIGTHHVPLTTYWRRVEGFRLGDFPAADMVAARAIAIPMHAALTLSEQETVAATLIEETATLRRVCGVS